MKKQLVVFTGVVAFVAFLASGQGIRKEYHEMTEAEKSAYVDALNSPSVYNEEPEDDLNVLLSTYHETDFDIIHTPENVEADNEFLPWHRMALWEMEDAIQRSNPNLTIPYWDWRITTNKTDSLFEHFLSIENLPPWDFFRSWYGDYPLTISSTNVDNIQATTPFWEDEGHDGYSKTAESEFMAHDGAHMWVRGTMENRNSPLDPVFFLHHAMVDKLWQQWEEVNNSSAFSMYLLTRYDGMSTSPLYPGGLRNVNPNTIVDGRSSMGTFYSEGGVAKLNGDYDVTNDYQTPEHFVYPKVIKASAFTVPSGKSAVIHSNTQIVLESGFVSRGHLELKVGGYDDLFPSSLTKRAADKKPALPGAFTGEPGIVNVSRKVYNLEIAYRVPASTAVMIAVYDPQGKSVGPKIASRNQNDQAQSVFLPLPTNYRGPVVVTLRAQGKTYNKMISL